MSKQKISLTDWQQQLGAVAPPRASPADNQVYSTDGGRVDAPAPIKPLPQAYKDGVVRLKRETKGRNGKAVTVISGIAQPDEQLQSIAATLKKKCGCGGSVKDGLIEIQGENRELIAAELQKLGFKTKLA
jgi:translation initiation factor 1